MNLNKYYNEGTARALKDYEMQEYDELRQNYIKFKESLNKSHLSRRLNAFIKGYHDEAERLFNKF